MRGNRPRCCIYKSLELGVLFLETSSEVGVIYTYNLEDPFLIGIIIIQRKVKSNKKKNHYYYYLLKKPIIIL